MRGDLPWYYSAFNGLVAGVTGNNVIMLFKYVYNKSGNSD